MCFESKHVKYFCAWKLQIMKFFTALESYVEFFCLLNLSYEIFNGLRI